MTDEPKPLWTTPAGVVVLAVVVLLNFVADYFWFKPGSLVSFFLMEAAVLGIIFVVANRITSRNL